MQQRQYKKKLHCNYKNIIKYLRSNMNALLLYRLRKGSI